MNAFVLVASEFMDKPLAGVLVGGFIGVIGSVIVPWLNRRADRKSLRCALRSEISGLLSIIERRQFIPGLENQIALAQQSADQNAVFSFHFSARTDYFAVYHANLENIGMLKGPAAAKVVKLYCQAAAILDDIEDRRLEENLPNDRAESIERLQQLLNMFNDTVALGTELRDADLK